MMRHESHAVLLSLVVTSITCHVPGGQSEADDQTLCLVAYAVDRCGANRIVLIADGDDRIGGLIANFLSTSSVEFALFRPDIEDTSHQEMVQMIVHSLNNQAKRPTTFILVTSLFVNVLGAAETYFHEEGRSHGSIAPHSTKWLIFVNTRDQLDTLKEQQRNSTYDNIAAAVFHEGNATWDLHTFMWRENRNRAADFVDSANVCKTSAPCVFFPNVRLGLNGRHLKTLTKVHWGFFVAIRNNPRTGKLEYYGFLHDIIDILADSMNFTYTVLPPPEEKQISWDAYAHMTVRGDVDLGMTTWAYSWGNIYDISFTYPVLMDQFTGIYRRHLPGSTFDSFFLMCPFNPLTYAILIISCVYTCLHYVVLVSLVYPDEKNESLRAFGIFSLYKKRKRATEIPLVAIAKALVSKMAEIYWTFMASIVNQAYLPRPKQMSARVLLFLWSLGIVMFYAIYTGSLTAEMVARPDEAPFRTFREMINKGNYRWGTIDNSGIHRVMNSTKGGIIQALNKSAENIPDAHLGDVYDTLTFMLDYLQDDYVFIHFHSLLNQIRSVSRQRGQFNMIPEPLMTANQGFICPLRSELCELLSKPIKRLYSSGMVQRMYRHYTNGNGTTREELDKDSRSQRRHIRLEDMRWPFTVIGILVASSVPVLAAERIFAMVCHLKDIKLKRRKAAYVVPEP